MTQISSHSNSCDDCSLAAEWILHSESPSGYFHSNLSHPRRTFTPNIRSCSHSSEDSAIFHPKRERVLPAGVLIITGHPVYREYTDTRGVRAYACLRAIACQFNSTGHKSLRQSRSALPIRQLGFRSPSTLNYSSVNNPVDIDAANCGEFPLWSFSAAAIAVVAAAVAAAADVVAGCDRQV